MIISPNKIYSIQQIPTEYVPGIILGVMNMAKSKFRSLYKAYF